MLHFQKETLVTQSLQLFVHTPTGPGNEGERANTPERTPSGKPAKPKDKQRWITR